MNSRIFLASPHMSSDGYELEYIHDAFRKNWISPLGENVTAFEDAIADYLENTCPVALASGTAALHLSMILAGVKAGDLVFCQSLTFAASANPIAYTGATPVFIDSERDTWNLDPAALKRAIALYGVPKALVVVHLYGTPARMQEITAICEKHGITLIEDAAEALGSTYGGRCCGSLGEYGVISFNGNKIITSSGGGMLLCPDRQKAAMALKLATQAREPFPWYQHEMIGYNYRLSNISAGIGRGQMKVLPQRIIRKQEIFRRYRRNLENLPFEFQLGCDKGVANRWLTAVLLEEGCGVSPAELIRVLESENIESRHVWKPLHSQPVFANNAYITVGEESVCDDLFARGLCLPSNTQMTDDDVDRVCGLIRKVFK